MLGNKYSTYEEGLQKRKEQIKEEPQTLHGDEEEPYHLQEEAHPRMLGEECGCRRPGPRTVGRVAYNSTTCSHSAYSRGGHQKVVSFSFYGDTATIEHKRKEYFQGDTFL